MKINEGETSFSLTGKNGRYKDDIESMIVRKGCSLHGYLESDCQGLNYDFKAAKTSDRIFEDLEDDDDTEDFGE